MGNYKEDVQALQDKMNALMEKLEKIQDERFVIEDNIKRIVSAFMLAEKHIKVNYVDLELGSCDCETSPTGKCVYNEASENCLICKKLQ